MEEIMSKDTKKSTPKERIVVLEKGKAIEIDALAFCCYAAIMPFRGWS